MASSMAFVALAFCAFAAPACDRRPLSPDGGTSSQAGTSGQAGAGQAGAGQAGTGGQAGTVGPADASGQAGTTGACNVDPTADRMLVASVHVTGSTNSGAIDVAVYSDGSAERTTSRPRYNDAATLTPDPKSYPPASPDVVTFLCDLAAAGPVTQIPITNCAKSVSFGTEMTLAVGADTSGDLECIAASASPAATALAHDCDVLTGRR